MTSVQIFAFVIMPVLVAVAGWIVAFIVNPPKRLLRQKTKEQLDLFDAQHTVAPNALGR